MFPQKKGLGVQLIHGAPGPALPLFQYDSEEPWVFARTRDGGVELHQAKDSLSAAVGAQVPPKEKDIYTRTITDDGFSAEVSDLPKQVLRNIELDEKNALENHPLIYDPIQSTLMDSGPIKYTRSSNTADCCAYVTGSAKSTLAVQVLHRPYREKVNLTSDETKGYVKPYALGYGASIPFSSPIQQVEMAKSSSNTFALQRYILVRTMRECALIYVHLNKGQVKLKKKYSFSVDKFGEEFAHLTFNPYNTRLFAVVGVKGKWVIIQASMTGLKYSITFLGATFDATDLSRFKRIAWTANEEKILIMGRKYVKIIDVLSGKSRDVISTMSWSQIREYKKWVSDDRYSFLLTSKELVLCDTQRGLSRLLSWNHNLNYADPSLMMSVSETDDVQFVFLHSLMSPIVLVFEFKVEDGMPKSLRDPYILDLDMNSQTHALLLYPCSVEDEDDDEDGEDEDHEMDDAWNQVLGDYAEAHEGKWFTLVQMTTELAVNTVLFGTESCTMINDDKEEEEDWQGKEEINEKQDFDIESSLIRLSKKKPTKWAKNAYKIIPELFDGVEGENNDPEAEDAEIFQDYASRFNIVKSADTKAVSLLKYTTPVDKFKSFEEFDNMLVQLKEHCESQGMDYLSFNQLSQSICGEKFDSLSLFFEKLRQLWNDDKISREVVRDIGLSLSVIYDKSSEDRKLQKSLESLPPKWKKIADTWDDEFIDSDEEYARSQRSGTDTEAPVVLQPTIRVTQTQNSQADPSSQMASQSIMKPSQRMSQRMTSQRASSQGMSQSQGPSQKKRKKRVKGFA